MNAQPDWRILGKIDGYYGRMLVEDVKEQEAEVYRWLNYRRFYHAREMGDRWERREEQGTERSL